MLGIKQAEMSHYMSGRSPTAEHKKLIIEYFGEEAVVAFGEHPGLYDVVQNWDHLSTKDQNEIVSIVRKKKK